MLRCDAAVAPVFATNADRRRAARADHADRRDDFLRGIRGLVRRRSQLWERNHRSHLARKHSDPRTDRSLVATIGGGGRQN